MSDQPAAISEAERRIIKLSWQRAPQTSEEIVAILAVPTDGHEKTIRSLLNRLLGKGAISASRGGRRYLYSPRLRR
jgi:predicted transcriptional regulator